MKRETRDGGKKTLRTEESIIVSNNEISRKGNKKQKKRRASTVRGGMKKTPLKPIDFGMKKTPLKLPERSNRPRTEEQNQNAPDFLSATLKTKARTASSKFQGFLEFSTSTRVK